MEKERRGGGEERRDVLLCFGVFFLPRQLFLNQHNHSDLTWYVDINL